MLSWLFVLLIAVALFLNVKSISLLKKKSEVQSFRNIIGKINSEDDTKDLVNKEIFEQTDLIISAVEYPIMNSQENFSRFKRKRIKIIEI